MYYKLLGNETITEVILDDIFDDLPGYSETDVRPDEELTGRIAEANYELLGIWEWACEAVAIAMTDYSEVDDLPLENLDDYLTELCLKDHKASEEFFEFVCTQMALAIETSKSLDMDFRVMAMCLSRSAIIHCREMLNVVKSRKRIARYEYFLDLFGALEGLATGWLTNGSLGASSDFENQWQFELIDRVDSIHHDGGRQLKKIGRMGAYRLPTKMEQSPN